MADLHYDVIVLGGGTMGTATAWALAKRGIKTLVLEQFRHVHAMGSHGGETRIIRHVYAEGEDYVPFVRRADALWLELERERDRQILVRTGGLDLAAPGYGYARAARRSADAQDVAYEWLAPSEVRLRWPSWLVPDDWEACFNPTTGFLLADHALHALGGAARRRGVAIHEEEPARDWGVADGAVWVSTDRGTYRGDRLILAPGAWAGDALAPLGVPFTVVRKTLWWLAVEDATDFAPERFPVFIAESDYGSIYGFPSHGNASVKIARHTGGEVTTPAGADRIPRREESGAVVPFAQQFLRGVSDRVTDSTVCLYEMTPDQDFIVDRHPAWPQVVIGAGFSGHGFRFAPAVGEILADLALDPGATPLPRFAIGRFLGRDLAPFHPEDGPAGRRYHELVAG